jgi:peptidoglycan hydrolase-like amidase
MNYMKKVFGLFVLLLVFFFSTTLIRGDELSDINDQLSKLKSDLASSQKATQPLESDLQKLTSQLNSIKASIYSVGQELIKKEAEVKKGEEVLAYQKKLLDERTFAYYKNSKKAEISLLSFLAAENLSQSLENFFYQKTLSDQDKQAILKIAVYLHDLQVKKDQLVVQKARLATLKTEVDKQSSFLTGEISKAKNYQAKLSSQINDLSARQQQIVAAKQSALASSTGLSTDTQSSSGGGSPVTQGYPTHIRVKFGDGHIETVEFEGKYLKSLGEMPEAWDNLEAFKAQVVAARSYALYKIVRASGRDFDVYADTRDQVYTGNEKGGKWAQAVNDTRGQYLKNGDSVILAYYSANAGGHTLSPNEAWNGGGSFPAGTNDVGDDGKGNSDLNARCIGTLRWEYHYNIGRNGHVQYNDTCPGGDINNSNSPLSNSEVEYLVDATTWTLRNGHVPERDKSHDQIKSEIGSDAIGNIQSLNASIADNKYTNNLHVVGSNRTLDFSGDQAQTFRLVFNVLSPDQYLILSTAQGAHYVKYDVLSSEQAHGTQGQGWYFYTYGYGHRIGMDQEGALGMASQNKTYTEILSHYYQGTSLTSVGYSGEVR